MRPLKYYVASTVDGFIAHPDGSWGGFLFEGDHVTDFLESYRWFDTVLMGRKTYEVALREGITNPYPTMKGYVFSRSMEKSPDENVQLVSEGAVEKVLELKRQPGKDIWLCGGAVLATTLHQAGLIDWLILKLNPVVLGSGIPLFLGNIETTALELTDRKIYDNGVLLLHYRVK